MFKIFNSAIGAVGTLAVLACLIPGSSGLAQDYFAYESTQDHGIYLKAFGGWADVVDIRKDDPAPDDIDINVSLNNGYTIGSAVGYQLNSRLRTEIEIAWRDTSTADLEPNRGIGEPLSGGQAHSFSIMLNGYLNTRSFGRVTPYLGLGLGISIDEANFTTIDSNLGNVFDAHSDPTIDLRFDGANFAGQVMAGLRMKMSPRVELFTEYRYFSTDSFQLHSDAGDFDAHLRSHNLLGGVSLSF